MKFNLLAILLLSCSIFANAQTMDKEVKYGEVVKCRSAQSFDDSTQTINYPEFKLTYQGNISIWYPIDEKTGNRTNEVESIFVIKTPLGNEHSISVTKDPIKFTLDQGQIYYELHIINVPDYANNTIEIKITKIEK